MTTDTQTDRLTTIEQELQTLTHQIDATRTSLTEKQEILRQHPLRAETHRLTLIEIDRELAVLPEAIDRAQQAANLAFGLSHEASTLADLQQFLDRQAKYEQFKKEAIAKHEQQSQSEEQTRVQLVPVIERLQSELADLQHNHTDLLQEQRSIKREQAQSLYDNNLAAVKEVQTRSQDASRRAVEERIALNRQIEQARRELPAEQLRQFNVEYPVLSAQQRLIQAYTAFLDALIVEAPAIFNTAGFDPLFALALSPDEIRDAAYGSPTLEIQNKRLRFSKS